MAKHRVIIEVSGGNVQNVYADDEHVEFMLVDWDNIEAGDEPDETPTYRSPDASVEAGEATLRFAREDWYEKHYPTELNGYEVRHDHLGWYILTDEEAAHEDEGNASVGFDLRDHWPSIEEASKAMQALPVLK